MSQENEDTKEQNHRNLRTVIKLAIGLALAVSAIYGWKYYRTMPKAPPEAVAVAVGEAAATAAEKSAEPAPSIVAEATKHPSLHCEVDAISAAGVAIDLHVLHHTAQEGRYISLLVRCKDAPPIAAITLTISMKDGESIDADFLLEQRAGNDTYEVIVLGQPPVGEFEVHVSVEGQEVAWTWFRVVAP